MFIIQCLLTFLFVYSNLFINLATHIKIIIMKLHNTPSALVDQAQILIDILEGISYFENCIKSHKRYIDKCSTEVHLPKIIEKCKDHIDHYERCIGRLTERYYKQLKRLNNA